MSRSLFLPLMALAGIVLYGTTQAARPELPPPSVPVSGEVSPRLAAPETPVRRAPPPPPAPRLQSEVEAEERAAAEAAQAARDTAGVRRDSLAGPSDDPSGL